MGNIITEDNSRRSIDWQDDDKINIEKISSHKISELRSDSDSTLLIFPFNLDQYGDNIKNEVVCKIKDNNIHTGNIMGFVGVNDTQITIRSRFDSSQREDFFMHYMLQKVFSINIFDLKHSSSNESVFDFILYLFPYYLKKALRQGVFKQYQTKHFNDANIRGVINVNRHMSNNIPFAGKVAYRTREHSNDNLVTQLIRHTIEYIRDHKLGRNILQTDNYTKECVEIICDATTSYNRNNRDKILNGNNKSVSHPYFSSYTILQKLCKSILTHKGLKYGKKDNKIYGLLFDGAWLWEEYLFTILVSYGFRHPRNKMGKDHIYLFEKKELTEDSIFETHSRCRRYPDYYKEEIVIDAKYKKMEDGKINRDDMHQIVTYMYVEKATLGGFIHPTKNHDCRIVGNGQLRGYGGYVFVFDFPIPQDAQNFNDFVKKINGSEQLLRDAILSDFNISFRKAVLNE